MWNDQKNALIEILKNQKSKKKAVSRKRRLIELLKLGDEVRDEALKSYYKLCKEKAAVGFIQWRIEQARLQAENPYLKKALRLRRLISFQKYNKEQELFNIYMDNEKYFEKVKPELIRLELEIQKERDISVWQSMYELIKDGNASTVY